MADKLISSLTAATSIADADWLVIENAAGNSRKVSGADAKSSMSPPSIPEGRLTLVSATPVLTSDQTAKTAIYYALYHGDRVPLYDGANWDNTAFTELTLTLDATNHVTTSLYDVFICLDTTVKIGTGPVWTSNTGRGTGAGTTELQRLNGIWTNKVSIALKNGAGAAFATIAANRATYVGTFYTTAAGQTGMAMSPAGASGGSNAILGISNAYNRVLTASVSRDSAASWTYNSTTIQQQNNSASNRITYVDGLGESTISGVRQQTGGGGNGDIYLGFARDSTTVFDFSAQSTVTAAGANLTDMAITGVWSPSLGLHYIQGLEATSTTQTFYGSVATPTRQLNAMTITLEM